MANPILDAANAAQNFINQNNPLNNETNQLFEDGFTVPPTYSSDGNGLPYNQVANSRTGNLNRNIITWFVPQFGTIRMYVNPNSMSISNKKLITKDRTKGGFTLQYWGEDLTNISIGGTTGSAGAEGINVLYELYRSEQLAFDSVGLSLQANNFNNDLSHNLINGVSSMFGADAAGAAGLLGGIFGLDSPTNGLAAKNIPSLAQLAFGVEMYYNGVVYRGFFESMTVNERAESFCLEYQIIFTATQKRGYRTNYFPWHRSASNGPSNDGTPYSYMGPVNPGTISGK